MEKWKGKIAVVTGSSSGLGYAVFQELIKHEVIAIGLDIFPEATEKLIKEQNLKGFAYKCDVGKEAEVDDVFKKIEEKFGVVNILINNAGIGRKGEILDDKESTMAGMNQMIDVNFRGVLCCTRKAFKLMSNDYGLIININSLTGHSVPFLNFSINAYPSTKFAVTALTETIRHELFRAGNKKVRVASISPGSINTGFPVASGYLDGIDPKHLTTSSAPLLNPNEIAKCISFILSTPYEVNITDLTIRSTGERL